MAARQPLSKEIGMIMETQNEPTTIEECEEMATKCHQAGANLTVQAARQFFKADEYVKRAAELAKEEALNEET